MEKLKRFVEQSVNYPFWWRNYKWWGYRNNRENWLYKLYFWANKERFDYDTRIYCSDDCSMSLNHLVKEKLIKKNPYSFVPRRKLIISMVFDKIKNG